MTVTKTQGTSKCVEIKDQTQPFAKDVQITRNGEINVDFDLDKSSEYEIYQIAKLKWFNIIFLSVVHLIALRGLYNILTFNSSWGICFLQTIILVMYGLGITAGAHRLWAHRAYKAKLPLKIFLMLMNCGALQTNLYDWVRDHRVHHAFTDTNADPHNSTRGFFFSHVVWLFFKKHPDVGRKGKVVDMSDILADPVIQFQMKYYLTISTIMTLVIPVTLQCYFFDSTILDAVFCRIGVYAFSLNGTWAVNSFAHIWGTKPFQKNISARQNLFVAIITIGEGWHNYHHLFPWDYKASELPFIPVDLTTHILHFMAKIGWATNLRAPSREAIQRRMLSVANNSDLNDARKFTD